MSKYLCSVRFIRIRIASKRLFVTLLFLFLFSIGLPPIAGAQTSVELRVSRESVGQYLAIGVISDCPFRIDFGDGRLIDFPVSPEVNLHQPILAKAKGDRIRIEASGGNILALSAAPHSTSINGEVVRADNRVLAIDLSRCASLERLDCDNNEISGTLDLSACPNIHTLYAHRNAISSLALHKEAPLRHINISANDLTFLDLSTYNGLVSVYAYENRNLARILLPRTLPELRGINLRQTGLPAENLNILFRAAPDLRDYTPEGYRARWHKKADLLGIPGVATSCTSILSEEKGWHVNVKGDCSSTQGAELSDKDSQLKSVCVVPDFARRRLLVVPLDLGILPYCISVFGSAGIRLFYLPNVCREVSIPLPDTADSVMLISIDSSKGRQTFKILTPAIQ